MEWERNSCTIEVLQSFCIDIKQTSKVLFAKSIINKSLEQVLHSHCVDFNSTLTLPPQLSSEKCKIKSFKLFWTFAEKRHMTMMCSNLPSRENFIKALEIDKWSKKQSKKPSNCYYLLQVKAIMLSQLVYLKSLTGINVWYPCVSNTIFKIHPI